MARFKVGERVRILSTVTTPFAGLEAQILEVKAHPRGVATLDQYVVGFSWGESSTFYDVQLETAVVVPKRRSAA
jgi:transcription antitermination factor NusG